MKGLPVFLLLHCIMSSVLCRRFVIQIVSGYLPSVILLLFLYTVPPLMMLFSSLEGPVSHSGRKRSACYKVLYFTIWNVFLSMFFWIYHQPAEHTIKSEGNTHTACQSCPHSGDHRRIVMTNDIISFSNCFRKL